MNRNERVENMGKRHGHDMDTTWTRHGHDMGKRHGRDMDTTWGSDVIECEHVTCGVTCGVTFCVRFVCVGDL